MFYLFVALTNSEFRVADIAKLKKKKRKERRKNGPKMRNATTKAKKREFFGEKGQLTSAQNKRNKNELQIDERFIDGYEMCSSRR